MRSRDGSAPEGLPSPCCGIRSSKRGRNNVRLLVRLYMCVCVWVSCCTHGPLRRASKSLRQQKPTFHARVRQVSLDMCAGVSECTKQHAKAKQVVAMYEFDPAQLNWPFKSQQPLALLKGQAILLGVRDETRRDCRDCVGRCYAE